MIATKLSVSYLERLTLWLVWWFGSHVTPSRPSIGSCAASGWWCEAKNGQPDRAWPTLPDCHCPFRTDSERWPFRMSLIPSRNERIQRNHLALRNQRRSIPGSGGVSLEAAEYPRKRRNRAKIRASGSRSNWWCWTRWSVSWSAWHEADEAIEADQNDPDAEAVEELPDRCPFLIR